MGCICSKGINQDGQTHRAKSLKRFLTLSKKGNVVAARVDVASNGNPMDAPQDNAVTNSLPPLVAEREKTAAGVGLQRRVTLNAGASRDSSETVGVPNEVEGSLEIVDVPNGFSGEHVAAGWPSWLTAVAAEAIDGARDLESGKIVALKKVRFVNMDPESVRFMAREIHILRRLDHPNVIKLEGIVTSRMSCNLYLVFEYMEHDLAGLAARPGPKFTEPQVKCYMQQLLEGLAHCHSRGILHRDIKGSNLLIDNNGILKIADFGLATLFNPYQKQSLTSRVVTLWYRPPELLLGATEYGVAVDLWSSGCILAELLAGKPIMPGRTEV
ncbi:hypothetical protein BHE74_00037748 [Ensete ventricosum]|nr:hypothetical protein GW17_00048590 [Ensete ventricosum]RWW55607.1 hypothetical protein BHE74_00037748 [Ensete ventricosum]